MQISPEDKDSDLFANLQREIAIEILRRLPVGSIISCKLVCRAWRELVECREFADFHHHLHLIVFPEDKKRSRMPYRMLELEVAPSNNNNNMVVAQVLNLGLSDCEPLARYSVKGLILLRRGEHILICNPITREYVRLPNPPLPPESRSNNFEFAPESRSNNFEFGLSITSQQTFGFGLSRTSQQCKVVRIVQSECRVYTLGGGGTEEWRSIVGPSLTLLNRSAAFVGGKLHWLMDRSELVCCFDLETEVFTSFSAPPLRRRLSRLDPKYRLRSAMEESRVRGNYRSLSVLENCLCLCEQWLSRDGEFVIWLMRDGRYWTREFVIPKHILCTKYYRLVFPIKVLEDGDILLGIQGLLLYYSNKKTTVESHAVESYVGFDSGALFFTPSFRPLKTMLMDTDMEDGDVQSF